MTLKYFACPFCGHHKTRVICGYRGRVGDKKNIKWRYRRCPECHTRMKTAQKLIPVIGAEELSPYSEQKVHRTGQLLEGKWPSAKLKPSEVLEVRRQWAEAEYKDDQLAIEISRIYEVQKRTILRIVQGLSWKALLEREEKSSL